MGLRLSPTMLILQYTGSRQESQSADWFAIVLNILAELWQVASQDQKGITRVTLPKDKNPFDLFDAWYAEAAENERYDHTAVALATADAGGLPNVRMVLLKAHGPAGFVFYTNGESAKGEELAGNMQAALCFHWKELGRQVRVRGPVEEIPPGESDAYFASRDRGSRIGAWASKQSRPLEGRFALEKEVAKYATKFGVGEIERPAYWGGYRVIPQQIEFWQHRDHRLHDRAAYVLDEAGAWVGEWLYP